MNTRLKLVFAIVFCLVSFMGIPQLTAQSLHSSPKRHPHRPPFSQIVYVPFEAPENTEVYVILSNNGGVPLEVTPTLYTDGHAIVGAPLFLMSDEIKRVPLSSLFASRKTGVEPGMVAFSYVGEMMQFATQFSVSGFLNGTGAVDFISSDEMEFPSLKQDAVFWAPRSGTAVILLANRSNETVHVSLSGVRPGARRLAIPSYTVKQVTVSFQAQENEPRSIHVENDGAPGMLLTSGYVRASNYLAPIRAYDPIAAQQSELVATNICLRGCDPHIVIKNVSEGDVVVSPAFTSINSQQQFQLDSVVLQPAEQRELDLNTLLSKATYDDAFATVAAEILHNGAPGAVIGSVTSFERTKQLTYEMPLKDPGKLLFSSGAYPVIWDPGFTNVVAVTNPTDQTLPINASLSVFGERYVFGRVPIAPHTSYAFDLDAIKSAAIPDRNGKTIPVDATIGKFRWHIATAHDPGSSRLIGRSSISNVSQHLASSFSCANCFESDYSPMVSPPSAAVAVSNSFTFDSVDAYTAPNNNWTRYSVNPYFTPDVNGIVSISGQYGTTVTGQAPGLTNLLYNFNWFDYYDNGYGDCMWEGGSYQDSVQVTVTGPTIGSISPTSAIIGTSNVQITINGSGFGSSPTVNLPSGFSKVSQTNNSSSQIVIKVNIAHSANFGNNQISVTAGSLTSNSKTFLVDGPYYLVVNSDIFNPNSDGNGNGSRFINYQVKNYSGSNVVRTIPIGETNSSDTGWNCTNHSAPTLIYTACGTDSTNSDGTFTDRWGLSGASYTPSGCGFASDSGTWNWCDGASFTHELVVINGWVHTNAVREFNVTNPPDSIPSGTAEPH